MSGNLFRTIEDAIADRAAPFLVLPDGSQTTYGEMFVLSGQFAHALTANGVARGDRVAVQTGKCAECLWLYLACLRIGAVYLPLNSAYTAAEITYFVGDAEPTLFVCDAARLDDMRRTLADGAQTVLAITGADAESLAAQAGRMPEQFDTVDILADDLAAILYTSGTTGRSKGAMITHENLRSNALALVDIWRFGPADRLLHALPIYHTHGLFVATNTILLAGASMLFLPKFDVEAVLNCLPQATTMMGVPTFYSRLLARPDFTAETVSNMRLFISGSAPLSAEVHRTFTARTGLAILERYGMTETNMITSNPHDGPRKPGAVGFPLPGVTARIADPHSGQLLDQGEIGVIELTGPNVFKGYWRMPEKTRQVFRDDGYFITGDLGYIDDDGYFTISGRDKDLIISGGLNVYPAEIENALDALDGIAESAIIGLPHADFGEAVTAIVVASDTHAVEEDTIRRQLQSDLAKFKVPRRVITIDSLPRNTMGKVQKNLLREEFVDLYRE
ncbi:MAG: malonyl-CoA synthase [Alphaproteobacteria bacterium]|nr:malonyl-CoA synthase [Alphaproteobacteria bacterium]